MIEFRVGDVRELLAELPAGSVDLYLDELAKPQPEPPAPIPEHEQEAML